MRYLISIICSFAIIGCTVEGLKLITALEARELKREALIRRAECESNHRADRANRLTRVENCLKVAVLGLAEEECYKLRKTEPMPQNRCTSLLYRIVMDPASLFPNYPGGAVTSYPTLSGTLAETDIGTIPKLSDIQDFSSTKKQRFILDLIPRLWFSDRLFASDTGDYEIFEELFKEDNSNLNKTIHGQLTTIQYILAEGNYSLLKWIDDFFEKKCDGADTKGKRRGQCIS